MPSTLMLLSNPYRPDPRVLTEARALRGAGYEVSLIAWDREQSRPREADEDGVHIIRLGPMCPARYPTKILRRLPRFWSRALKASRGLRFDVVHAHDFDTLPLGMLIARLSGKPLLYDAHELYSKMIENEVGALSGPLWLWERRCARRADTVITVSEALADELSLRRMERALVVSTSQDPSILRGADRKAVRDKYGMIGFTISYLGSLEPGRFIEEFISSFGPGEKTMLIVGGSGTLQPLVAKESLHNSALRFIGTVDADEALRISWASDLVLAMMDPKNPNNVVGTPGKIINAMAVGRPLVTTKGLDIAKKVGEAGCGIVIPYSKAAFVEAIVKAAADTKGLEQMGQRGREYYEKMYSWERSREGLLKAYKALLTPS